MAAALFISDLHLCPTRPLPVRQFRQLLAGPATAAGALYVLGDLFEYWAGDDDLADPFNAAIADDLRQLCAAGTPVFFLAGNRDFLADAGFCHAAGVTLLEEPHLATIGGAPTLLLHGDTLCRDDLAYQQFRREVRSPAWRDAFLALPLAERRGRIEVLRRQSEIAKRAKTEAAMDINAQAVAELLREYGYPRLIHGHIHKAGYHRLSVDGRLCERWVLGDWYQDGSYLACDAQGCRQVSLAAAEAP